MATISCLATVQFDYSAIKLVAAECKPAGPPVIDRGPGSRRMASDAPA